VIPIGCAWLNKPNNLHSGGWASLDGAEPFKFTDLESLRSKGPIWVTQCAPKTFAAEGGKNFPWLRHSEFLPTPLNFLAEELAVVESPLKACAALSEVLTRTAALACDWIPGFERDLADPELAGHAMHEVMQLSVAPAGRGLDLPADLLAAMPQMFPSLANRDVSWVDLLVRVPANRIGLYEDVITLSIPGDIWVEIDKDTYPNPLTWAISNSVPIIAQVTVIDKRQKGKDKDGAAKSPAFALANLAKGTRRWMARPEIEALSKIYELRAERVFVCDGLLPASAALKVAPPIFSPVARASISAGLFAETFLHAAASPSPITAVRQDGAAAFCPYSIRAVWLTSLARAEMIEAAIELTNRKATVLGVGVNHIFVGDKKVRLRSMRKTIQACHRLAYPTGVKHTEVKFAPKSTAVYSYETAQDEEGGE